MNGGVKTWVTVIAVHPSNLFVVHDAMDLLPTPRTGHRVSERSRGGVHSDAPLCVMGEEGVRLFLSFVFPSSRSYDKKRSLESRYTRALGGFYDAVQTLVVA